MPNIVLERLREQRSDQIGTMDAILEQVTDRDLVDAERSILESCRQRIGEIDAQIEPLAAFESVRDVHDDAVNALPRPVRAVAARSVGTPEPPTYPSAGSFLVDYLRGYGYNDPQRHRDDQAMSRVQASYSARAVADQTTSDTAGILPTPIVGQVVDLIDANRPLITSLGGAKALGGIPGATFTRPKIVTHTTVGLQPGEKQQLPSQKMSITGVPFTKQTYGGTVDISRQDIDWTSPAAWDILVGDLANVYAVQTETAVATAFHAAAGTAVPVATDDLKGWTTALYTAAMHSYQAGKRMPDRVWCSLDVWAALGSLVDAQRVVLPPDAATGGDAMDSFDVGGSNLSSFRGDVLGLPRIVVPTFAAGTCIVGPSALFEVYEEVIGLLSVIEPSILGVEVAYGGYVAFGSMATAAFVPLGTGAITLPTAMESDDDGPEAHDATPKRANGAGK